MVEAFDTPPNVLTDDIRVYCWIAALVGIFFPLSALALAFAFGLGWWAGKRAGLAEASAKPKGAAQPKDAEPAPAPTRGRTIEGVMYTTRFGDLWHTRRECRHLLCATAVLDRKPCLTCAEADLAETPVGPHR